MSTPPKFTEWQERMDEDALAALVVETFRMELALRAEVDKFVALNEPNETTLKKNKDTLLGIANDLLYLAVRYQFISEQVPGEFGPWFKEKTDTIIAGASDFVTLIDPRTLLAEMRLAEENMTLTKSLMGWDGTQPTLGRKLGVPDNGEYLGGKS